MLAAGCAGHAPAVAAYDFDAIEPPPAPTARLSASLTVATVSAPAWLSSKALSYRLAYASPAPPRTYVRSRWTAPPADLLTARLRQLLVAANAGFTLARGPGTGDYRLQVALEQLEQVWSRCTRRRRPAAAS
jgi:cholesterol transport system auxiliary component